MAFVPDVAPADAAPVDDTTPAQGTFVPDLPAPKDPTNPEKSYKGQWDEAKTPMEKLSVYAAWFAHPFQRYSEGIEKSFEVAPGTPQIPKIEGQQGLPTGVQEVMDVGQNTINTATGMVNAIPSPGAVSLLLNPGALVYAAPFFAAKTWDAAKKTGGDFLDAIAGKPVTAGQLSEDVLGTAANALGVLGGMHGAGRVAGIAKGLGHFVPDEGGVIERPVAPKPELVPAEVMDQMDVKPAVSQEAFDQQQAAPRLEIKPLTIAPTVLDEPARNAELAVEPEEAPVEAVDIGKRPTPEEQAVLNKKVEDDLRSQLPKPGQPTTEPGAEYGIAARVSEARGLNIEPGAGINPEESVAAARERYDGGVAAKAALDHFNQTKQISEAGFEDVRQHGEQLFKTANAAMDEFGENSTEYQKAAQADVDWHQAVKPMQTAWSNSGKAMQGSVDIDTGTFHGMRRAFIEANDKDFTPEQAAKAQQIAQEVKKGSGEADTATEAWRESIAKRNPEVAKQTRTRVARFVSDLADDARARIASRRAEGRVQSGLDPTDLADHAIVGADYILKGAGKLEDWSEQMLKEFGDRIKPHLQAIWDEAKQRINELNDEKMAKALEKKVESINKQIADKQEMIRTGKVQPEPRSVDRPQVQPVEEAKQRLAEVNKQLADARRGGPKFEPGSREDVLKRANDYLNKGVDDPNDITSKIASDTGLSFEEVAKKLTPDKASKRISDEMYAKMAAKRRLVSNAQMWLAKEANPAWMNTGAAIPNVFFNLRTFGHGTVGPVTHAAVNWFLPQNWSTYWPEFFKQYQMAYGKDGAYHEMRMQGLVRSENYITARRAGLANDPFRATDDYQNSWLKSSFGKAGLAGNRGFDSLKLIRQGLFDNQWNLLSKEQQTPLAAELLADMVNHETGVIRSSLGPFSGAARTGFFAPKLEASRWAWLYGDPIKAAKVLLIDGKDATPEARVAAIRELKTKATFAGMYFAALAANEGLLKATGSDQDISFDPTQADFLAFKVAGHRIGIINPIIGTVRFVADLYNMSSISGNDKAQRGSAGERTAKYLRGKLSPFAGTVADLYSGSDYQGRPMPFSDKPAPKFLRAEGVGPYSYAEYTANMVAPIPVEEIIKEQWVRLGMNPEDAPSWLGTISEAAMMGSTGVRVAPDYKVKE